MCVIYFFFSKCGPKLCFCVKLLCVKIHLFFISLCYKVYFTSTSQWQPRDLTPVNYSKIIEKNNKLKKIRLYARDAIVCSSEPTDQTTDHSMPEYVLKGKVTSTICMNV